jgi:hypothetical protein
MRAWFCAVLASFAAFGAAAETVVLRAVERGVFREDGSWELGPTAPYTTGRGDQGEERSVFVFDVSGLDGTLRSATLRIWSHGSGGVAPHQHQRVTVYGVSSDPGMLAWEPASLAVAPSRGTFWDLGSGQVLGSGWVPRHDSKSVEIRLDPAVLRVLERSGGLVAFGASLDPPRGWSPKRAIAAQRVFASLGSGTVLPAPELVVTRTRRVGTTGPVTLQVDGRSRAARARGRPLRSLAAALDLATPGDTVRIAPGLYPDTILMKEGVDVIGAGADRTLIELAAGAPDVRCANAILSGLSIFRTDGGSNAIDCTNGASPAITRVAVSSGFRAAVLVGSNATLAGSQIYGTIEATDSAPKLTENLIDGSFGALSFTFDAEPNEEAVLIERNRIRGPVSFFCGVPAGGLIVGNHLSARGNRLTSPEASIRFIGSGDLGLIANNTFDGTGGVVLGDLPRGLFPLSCDGEKHVTLANNILAFGSAGVTLDFQSTATVVANNVFGNLLGIIFPRPNDYVGLPDLTGVDGNLSMDPLLARSLVDDPGVLPESPVIDAGANEFAASEIDLLGRPRIVDGGGAGDPAIDIGAAEHQPGENARVVQMSVATNAELGRFVFRRNTGSGRPIPPERTLCPARSFRAAFLSGPEFDPATDLDRSSVEIEGSAPRGRLRECRVSDVDDDGDQDLECRFPFDAIDALAGLPLKDVCLTGRTLDGSAVRGCQRLTVFRLADPAVQECGGEHTAWWVPFYPDEPVPVPLP